jgi:hypothetical protein
VYPSFRQVVTARTVSFDVAIIARHWRSRTTQPLEAVWASRGIPVQPSNPSVKNNEREGSWRANILASLPFQFSLITHQPLLAHVS